MLLVLCSNGEREGEGGQDSEKRRVFNQHLKPSMLSDFQALSGRSFQRFWAEFLTNLAPDLFLGGLVFSSQPEMQIDR